MNGQTETIKPVSNVVSAIREEAMQNEVFGAICHDFAQRKRTREALTVRGLKARMEKHGVDFKDADYVSALRFLSDLGLGTLRLDRAGGRIIGLGNIKVTLQSIGQASGLKVADLQYFKPQRRFQKLAVPSKQQKQTTTHVVKTKPLYKKQYTAHLLIKQGDNPITIPGPVQLSADELGEFLIEFSQMTKRLTQ